MKLAIPFLASFLLFGCMNTTFVAMNRSNYENTANEASTYGTLTNSPKSGSQTSSGEKTSDTDTPVNVNSGETAK